MTRFTATKAVRGAIPLFIGLCGPSGSGKTYSADRLARGIQRVVGGRITFIDTENGRGLHYADLFDFDHMRFDPPYNPGSYIDAIEAAVEGGAKTIIIDSMTHEHSGIGGVLEMHEEEVQRLAEKMGEQAANFPAWAKPKAERRRLVDYVSRLDVNVIACFRAREKVKMLPKLDRDGQPIVGRNGKVLQEPQNVGWMPEAAPELVFEMTAMGVLYPGARGVPDWSPGDSGTSMVTKRPAQFEKILEGQLSEDMGEKMALWARGNAHPAEPSAVFKEALGYFETSQDNAGLAKASEFVNAQKAAGRLSTAELASLGKAYKSVLTRLAAAVVT
jgi:energy-coupling factor transporter ATP-binding protein EcfA2